VGDFLFVLMGDFIIADDKRSCRQSGIKTLITSCQVSWQVASKPCKEFAKNVFEKGWNNWRENFMFYF
jgi:hypothetical protein